MSQQKWYITPKDRVSSVVSACRLALVAFEDTDISKHLEAMDKLVALGEMELAQGFTCRWNNEQEMAEEKSETARTAYAEAQGYGGIRPTPQLVL